MNKPTTGKVTFKFPLRYDFWLRSMKVKGVLGGVHHYGSQDRSARLWLSCALLPVPVLPSIVVSDHDRRGGIPGYLAVYASRRNDVLRSFRSFLAPTHAPRFASSHSFNLFPTVNSVRFAYLDNELRSSEFSSSFAFSSLHSVGYLSPVDRKILRSLGISITNCLDWIRS